MGIVAGMIGCLVCCLAVDVLAKCLVAGLGAALLALENQEVTWCTALACGTTVLLGLLAEVVGLVIASQGEENVVAVRSFGSESTEMEDVDDERG